jgi:D-tyrosyl-tRNA(Tyr) deacylase
MRAVVQRVSYGSVTVENKKIGEINYGLVVLLGVDVNDNEEDVSWLANKIVNLRIFGDEKKLMNNSLTNVNADLMIISQFTLFAKTKKGNRPSYMNAAKPPKAVNYYNFFCDEIDSIVCKKVIRGIFGADMTLNIVNEGPVTIYIDTKNKE